MLAGIWLNIISYMVWDVMILSSTAHGNTEDIVRNSDVPMMCLVGQTYFKGATRPCSSGTETLPEEPD